MGSAVSLDRSLFSSCALVVVAAGKGRRFGGYKQLVPLADKPLVVQTLLAFASVPFHSRLVVLPEDFIRGGIWNELMTLYPWLEGTVAVVGGTERSLSVCEGVSAVSPECEFVAVHDGARPFPPLETLAGCLQLLAREPELAAAIVAKPMTDTIKRMRADGSSIQLTEDREHFLRAETPQVARRLALLNAFCDPRNQSARDEAEALERIGYRTSCVPHTGFNPKITHQKDLTIAMAWLSALGDTPPELGD